MQFSKMELDVFAASTTMEVGDGESALFWEDKWLDGRSIKELAPEVYALVPKHRRKARMVREAVIDRTWIPDIVGAPSALALWQYVQLWGRLRGVQLSVEHDRMVWRWTTDGRYSARSCYDTLFQGAITSGSWRLNWKSWAPPRVKFFIWLACMDRCWTGERLARRGLPHAPTCPLCDQAVETMAHLLTGCSFSRMVWFEVLSWIRSTSGPPTVEGDFAEWWSLAVRTAPRQLRKGTSSIIMLTAWWIWKHRNAAVFDNARPSVTSLFNDIRSDARLWADAGARGVR
jgi:hypothetical protein